MKLTDEQVAAIRDGCEGVTPGPWRGVANRDGTLNVLGATDDEGWCSKVALVNSSDKANAVHIARCDPDTIRALSTEVLESREALAAKDAENQRLVTGEPNA